MLARALEAPARVNVFKYITELPVELYCERMDAFRT